MRGLGFDATCSLAVFDIETDEPVCISGDEQEESAGEECRNIVLWLDHRAVEQTKQINATGHNLLRYVGGSMSVEMEIPKVLWLKNHLPSDVFRRCKFYDLADALTHMATGSDARSFCSTVCKQGYVPVGVDGSVKGWQDDFLRGVGLEELCEDEFKRMGGVNKVVCLNHPILPRLSDLCRMVNFSQPVTSLVRSLPLPPRTLGCFPASPSEAA